MSAKENARLDMAADLVIVAVESGMHSVRYWGEVTDYEWAAPDMDDMSGADALPEGRGTDARATILHEGKSFELTPAVVLRAMRDIVADSSWDKYGWDGKLRLRIAGALNDPDTADFDADDADCIVQRAMFAELIYG